MRDDAMQVSPSRWQEGHQAPTGPAPGGAEGTEGTEGLARHLHLAGTPWLLRTAISTDGRCALEVYAAGSLIDVMVAHSLGSRLLRGACTMVSAGRHRIIAWGCLPEAQDVLPLVEFVSGRLRPRRQAEAAEVVSFWFWVAATEGRFSRVAVASQTERASCRTRMVATC